MHHYDTENFQFNNEPYELRTRSDFHTIYAGVYKSNQLIGQEFSFEYPHGVGVLLSGDPLMILKEYVKEQFMQGQSQQFLNS